VCWPGASVVQDMPNDITQLKWTSVRSSRMLFDLGASVMRGPDKRLPQPEVQIGDLHVWT
jgi:hypothetical protein